MGHPDETALLVSARTPFEAKVISGLLASAGITVVSNLDLRNDEFAMAQSLMNLTGVDVYVAEEELDEAKRVLADARDSGQVLEAESVQDPDRTWGVVLTHPASLRPSRS